MIKVFTVNKDGKIEITKEELKALLDEAYWEGYHSNTTTYTYTSPYTWTVSSSSDTLTINASVVSDNG